MLHTDLLRIPVVLEKMLTHNGSSKAETSRFICIFRSPGWVWSPSSTYRAEFILMYSYKFCHFLSKRAPMILGRRPIYRQNFMTSILEKVHNMNSCYAFIHLKTYFSHIQKAMDDTVIVFKSLCRLQWCQSVPFSLIIFLTCTSYMQHSSAYEWNSFILNWKQHYISFEIKL